MALDRDCMNNVNGRCQALTGIKKCDPDCFARVEDPIIKLRYLFDIYQKSKNHNNRWKIKKEIYDFMKEHDLGSQNPFHDSSKYFGWYRCYVEDLKRGEKGGGASQKANTTGLKQRMKDNRPIECKNTVADREAYTQAIQEFEEEHGKLPKLSRYSLSKSKVDSYTGEPIEGVSE